MYAHERIDSRRGPGRERDDGRREIDAGVAECEEDRDAERADEYNSCEDWDLSESGGDALVRARVKDDGDVMMEITVPAFIPVDGLDDYLRELTRRIARDLSLAGGGKDADL